MFQSFEDTGGPQYGRERVTALRGVLTDAGLAGFIVPRSDAHQGEYVADCDERMLWLSGFSGSAGMAIVLERKAALFVDGRYTLQAANQVDTGIFGTFDVATEKPAAWLKKTLKRGDRLGFDPWLHTPAEISRLEDVLDPAGIVLEAVARNPVDQIWQDRPPPPLGRVTVHPVKLAGQTPQKKLEAVRETLKANGAEAVVLSLPDSIAWLLNIRGQDVIHNPVALAFAIVPARGRVKLFINARKLTRTERAHLKPVATVADPAMLDVTLAEMGMKRSRVQIDPASCPYAIADTLRRAGAAMIEKPDPCLLPKARKNAAEIKGARAAHLRDGVAVSRFLAWLDREAMDGKTTEIEAARKLEDFRSETGELVDISFDTISGAGPNGAIVHYRVSEASNRKLRKNSLYLVDSGGQYHDGTTDITRTVAIGKPSAEMRKRFTLVLKGHIALARACFPKGTAGIQLDTLARQPLWRAGLDYDHGTGHGVGSYLSVHEGPQNISKRPGGAGLEPGMILSNEPGYYKNGHYGIRIENLVLVRKAEGKFEREMLEFETLTLAPIDSRLIDVSLLDDEERRWLDAYHARVRHAIAPSLKGEERTWLEQATRPLPKD